MNRKLISSIIGIFFLIMSFMGFIRGDEAAHTIAFGYVWFCIIVSLFIAFSSDKLIGETFKKVPAALPRSLDIVADLAVIIMLLLDKHNHWLSALLFLGQIIIVNEAFKLGQKYRNTQLKEEKLNFDFDK